MLKINKVSNNDTINTFKQIYNNFVDNVSQYSNYNLIDNNRFFSLKDGNNKNKLLKWNILQNNLNYEIDNGLILKNNISAGEIFEQITNKKIFENKRYTFYVRVKNPIDKIYFEIEYPDGTLINLENLNDTTKTTLYLDNFDGFKSYFVYFKSSEDLSKLDNQIKIRCCASENFQIQDEIKIQEVSLYEGYLDSTGIIYENPFLLSLYFDKNNKKWKITTDGENYYDFLLNNEQSQETINHIIENFIENEVDSNTILNKLKQVDGSGSGLDADTLDGLDSSVFLRSDIDDVANGNIEFKKDIIIDGNGLFKNNVNIDGNTTINGNLIVNGTMTTVNTEELTIKDNIITLNSNLTSGNPPSNLKSGIEVLRGDNPKATFYWNENNDEWQFEEPVNVNKISFNYPENEENTDPFFIYRHNVSHDHSDLRLQIGDNVTGDDKLVIGTAPAGNWKDLFKFYNNGNAEFKGKLNVKKLEIQDSSIITNLNADLLDGHDSSYFAKNDLSNVANSNILNKLKQVDGSGSGLDADLLDGFNASQSPSYNEIPVLNSNGQLSLPFVKTPILVNGQDMMNRTFYVNATNGNDNNDGSHSTPFKTINKAIDSVPFGGYGTIHIIGDYTFNENVQISNKNICLCSNGNLIFTWKRRNDKYAMINGIRLINAYLFFPIDFGYEGKIIVEENTTGITKVVPDASEAITLSESSVYGGVYFFFRIRRDNYNPIVIKEGGLIGVSEWSWNRPLFMTISLSGHYAGINRSIKVDITNDAYLVDFKNTNGALYYSYEGGITDLNGNDISVKSVIKGIVKDTNGVPKNIVSNIILNDDSELNADLLDGHDSTYFAKNDLSNVSNLNILNKLKQVDGSGSGLDADLLDGKDSNYFFQLNEYAIPSTWSPKSDWQKVGGFTINHDYGKDTYIVLDNNYGRKVHLVIDGDVYVNEGSKRLAYDDLSNVSNNTILDKLKQVDGNGSGLDADLLDGHDSTYFAKNDLSNVSFGTIDNILEGKHLSRRVFVAGNNDWTSKCYAKTGLIYYDSNNKGVVFEGKNTLIHLRLRIPVNPNAIYCARVVAKKLSGGGKFYVGANSLDNNYNALHTDNIETYNYFCATGINLNTGQEYVAKGCISGYNAKNNGSQNKFDPYANYFDLVILSNYEESTSDTKTLIKSIEVYEVLPEKFTGTLIPVLDNQYSLGDITHKYSNIYATTFHGTATNADKLDGYDSTYFAKNDLSNVSDNDFKNKYNSAIGSGSGSGLNADLLDGHDSSYFTNANNLNSGIISSERLSGDYNINVTSAEKVKLTVFQQGVDSPPPQYFSNGLYAIDGYYSTDFPDFYSKHYYSGYAVMFGNGQRGSQFVVNWNGELGKPLSVAVRIKDDTQNDWGEWDYLTFTDLRNVDNNIILDKLKQVDGDGSGLDADTLDGLDSSAFLRRDKSSYPTQNNSFDLGSSSHKWKNIHANTFKGNSIEVENADLAEQYICKDELEIGDVVVISSDMNYEIEKSNEINSHKVLGVFSDNPALKMNNVKIINGKFIALKGRLPIKVIGKVNKGDPLVSYKNGYAISIFNEKIKNIKNYFIFAKALEKSETKYNLIECVIL